MVAAPPPQSVSGHLHGACLKSRFCSSHWANPNALFLQSPGLAHCSSLDKSQVQPSHISSCRFNRAPRQACPVGSAGQGRPPPPRLPASPGAISAWHPTSPLHLGISPFREQQRSVWKCSSDSPLHRHNENSNPGLFSQCHLESSLVYIFKIYSQILTLQIYMYNILF